MVSVSRVTVFVLLLCTASAAPARGQKSIQKKRARVAREVGMVGADGVKTSGGKVSIVATSNRVQPATVSFGSELVLTQVSDDEGPNVADKIDYSYTPTEEQSSLPSFNFVVFCVAVVGLVKLQLHLASQRREQSKGHKDGDLKDWFAMAQESPHVQEALAMVASSVDFAGSISVQARNALDRLASQQQKLVTDEKCDFGLPEDPSQHNTRTIQDPDFYQPQEAASDLSNIMEMSCADSLEMSCADSLDHTPTPVEPMDLLGMAPEDNVSLINAEPRLIDGVTDNNADDLVGL